MAVQRQEPRKRLPTHRAEPVGACRSSCWPPVDRETKTQHAAAQFLALTAKTAAEHLKPASWLGKFGPTPATLAGISKGLQDPPWQPAGGSAASCSKRPSLARARFELLPVGHRRLQHENLDREAPARSSGGPAAPPQRCQRPRSGWQKQATSSDCASSVATFCRHSRRSRRLKGRQKAPRRSMSWAAQATQGGPTEGPRPARPDLLRQGEVPRRDQNRGLRDNQTSASPPDRCVKNSRDIHRLWPQRNDQAPTRSAHQDGAARTQPRPEAPGKPAG